MFANLLAMVFGGAASGVGSLLARGGVVAAVVGGINWLLTDGREWHITVNALELIGLVFVGYVVIGKVFQTTPPAISRGIYPGSP